MIARRGLDMAAALASAIAGFGLTSGMLPRIPRVLRVSGLAAALVAAACVTGTGLAPAHAASVGCGTVVEELAVLDRDLRCAGPALVLRNPRTVVQMNGHVIESLRSCSEGAAPTGVTIQVTAEGAQILGPGVIRGFRTGVDIAGAARVEVRDLRISDSCGDAVRIAEAERARVRNVTLHRNGKAGVHAENSQGLVVEGSALFLNGTGSDGRAAALDFYQCVECGVRANRIVDNRGGGLRLDVESHGNEIERNLILDNRPQDVVDEGSDNTFVLNAFERGEGVAMPRLWPLIGDAVALPAVAGCGVMTEIMRPRETVTVTCPQDPGLRALRNSVVAYRLLLGNVSYGGSCASAQIVPASSSGGGAVRCTSPDPIWNLVLEVTCCLN